LSPDLAFKPENFQRCCGMALKCYLVVKKIAGFYSEVKQKIVILIQTKAVEMMGFDKLRLLCLQPF